APPEPPIDRTHLPSMPILQVMQRDASTLYASGMFKGVFRSLDNGMTWSQWFDKEPRSLSSKLFFDPHRPKTTFVLADQLFVGGGGMLYGTTDDGASWRQLAFNGVIDYMTIVPTTPVTVFTATSDSEHAGHYHLWMSA